MHPKALLDACTELVRLIHGDRNPQGPGYKEEAVAGAPSGEWVAHTQFTQLGGHQSAQV